MLHRCYICQITPFHNSRKPRISSFCCRFVTFRKNKKQLILFSPYNINIITNFARKSIESFNFFCMNMKLKATQGLKTLLMMMLLIASISATAQERRPIDSRHPLWLVHIDVWNKADPQKIIDLMPDEIRPYVWMNISMS